jgi:hypothetical protein
MPRRAIGAVIGDEWSVDAGRQPPQRWRPTTDDGDQPEEQDHGDGHHRPSSPAKRRAHAASSIRMSDACGEGFLPSSSMRAKIAVFLALNASTTAGSN